MGRRTVVGFLIASCLAVCAGAAPPGSNWRLFFADEFSGGSVDPVKWDTRYAWGRTHNHVAYMEDENVVVEDGLVNLNAVRESAGGKPFTSGVISSHGKFRFDEGYAEMRIKMPSKRGSWPAFWMLSNGWPPEIDIMEYVLFTDQSTTDRYAVNSFWGDCCNPPSNFSWIDTNQNLANGFHTFGLEWNASQLKYYFDGQLVKTASNQPEFENMYLIFNYAVGGWPGTPSTAQWAPGATDTTQADWVRVWQKVPTAPDTIWTNGVGAWNSWDDDANWTSGAPEWENQDAYLASLGRTSAMEVRWNDNKTVGNLFIDGNTVYTVGEAGGAVENLMFVDSTDGWSRLWVGLGVGGHTVNSRLDAWSNLSIKNDSPAPLTLNGDIRGQAREASGGTYNGGRLLLRSDTGGEIVLNGDAQLQRQTELRDGVRVVLNGVLYADDGPTDEAALLINDSTLRLGSLNAPDEGPGLASLGYLPSSSDRLVLDNGVVEITSRTITNRGFTIGAGGATLHAVLGPRIVFADSASNPERDVVSDSGGDLKLTGEGVATFAKRLGGTGGLRKQGGGVWTLFAANDYSGPTVVEQGTLLVDGATAAGLASVTPGAVIGGAGAVGGDLSVGGRVAPSGDFLVEGDADFLSGSDLSIDLEPTQHDRLLINGGATIAPATTLEVLVSGAVGVGDRFEILTASNGVVGAFSTLAASGLDPTLALSADYTANALSLIVSPTLQGDFNTDGVVDAADYTVWRDTYASTEDLRADADLDGVVNDNDYLLWIANVGDSIAGPSSTVPEPASMISIAIMAIGFSVFGVDSRLFGAGEAAVSRRVPRRRARPVGSRHWRGRRRFS